MNAEETNRATRPAANPEKETLLDLARKVYALYGAETAGLDFAKTEKFVHDLPANNVQSQINFYTRLIASKQAA